MENQIYLVTNQQRIFDDGIQLMSVAESLKKLTPLYEIGLDTETRGMDPYTKELLSLQLGCGEFQIVIDCTTVSLNYYKELLESPEHLFLGWNLKFDLKFLYHKGIFPRNVYDGYLAEKLMWLGYPTGMHSMSLKTAGIQYLGIELDKSVRGKIQWAGLTDDVIIYAALDVKYLSQIKAKQREKLEEKGLLTAIDYENRFVLPLAYCEYCGVKLNVEKWQEKMKKDQARVDAAIEELNAWMLVNEPDSPYVKVDRQGDLFSGFDLTPKVTINWNSTKQLIPIFKKYGIDVEVQDKEKGGTKDSIDAKQLGPQKSKCSLIPIYLNYREAVKVTSTYGDNFLKQINPVSHRIHTQFNQLGADTTRITSGGKDKENNIEYVNLLNLPADAETRECFCAEDGNKWISIDYSGQETYLMASIANDEAIIEELTNGSGDIHSLTAYMSYQEIPRDTAVKDIKKKFHNLRQEAKGIEFAINYGGNADTIARNKGIPIEEANKIYNSYMSGFKGLKKYQDFRRKDWFNKGYILLSELTGHKAFIYDWEELKEYQKEMQVEGFWDTYRKLKQTRPNAREVQIVKQFFKRRSASEKQSINYPIQAAGSMCLRVSMVNFFEWLRKNNLLFRVKICVTPYDEINCEAPAEIADEVANELYNCMVKAGAYFCTKCKLDADISKLEDGSLPSYWIH